MDSESSEKGAGRKKGIVTATEAMAWAEKEVKLGRSCRSLPFTIIFWLTFALVSVSHRQVKVVSSLQATMLDVLKSVPSYYSTQSSATQAETSTAPTRKLLAAGGSSTSTKTPILAKGFEDITTIDDIYGWISGVATPVLWGPASSSNSMQGLVRHFNRVVGGMRVMQTRAKEEECPGLDGLREVYGVKCYPQGSELSEERFVGEDPDEKGRYMYWLDIEHAVEKIKEELQGMKEREWISEATLQTLVETMLYNGEVGQFVLVQSYFTVDRGGSIKSKMKICALPTEVYPSWSAYFGDALWAALLIYLLVGEVYSIWSHLRKGKIKRLISVWVLLNWMAILGGIGIGAFFGWVAKRLDEVAEKITQMPAPPDNVNSTQWAVRSDFFHEQYDDVADICERQGWHELFMFWFTLLIMCKFFQAFQANPRLAVITTTLREASVDMLHFLLIFGIVFINYALGGHLLFGKQLKEWKSLGASVNACFLVLMGDFSYEEMYAIAPIVSQLWFWTYMLLVFLVMLNMLLAIVMDAYSNVKEQSQSSDSLYAQMWSLAQEVKKAKSEGHDGEGLNWTNAVGHTFSKKSPKTLEQVLLALEERQEENGVEPVSVELLIEIGIPQEHAEELFDEILRWKVKELKGGAEGEDGEGGGEEKENDDEELARLEEEYQKAAETASLTQLASRMDRLEVHMNKMLEDNNSASMNLLQQLNALINEGKNTGSRSPPRAPPIEYIKSESRPAPPSAPPKIKPAKDGRNAPSIPGMPDGDTYYVQNGHRTGNASHRSFNGTQIPGQKGRVLDI